MSDHNEPCGCEESQLLQQAINDYIEKHDDSGIRNMYNGPLGNFKLSLLGKLMHVDEPLSIEDRKQLRNYITKLEMENECLLKAQAPVTHMVEGVPVASAGEGRKLKHALKEAREKGAREMFNALRKVALECYHDSSLDAWLAGGHVILPNDHHLR